MNTFSIMAVSAAGMGAERARLEAAALNLANANTVATSEEQAYQPRKVVIQSVDPSFDAQVSQGLLDPFREQSLPHPVALTEIRPAPTLRRHDPSHPLADAQGLIVQPAVDPLSEMVTVMQALRAYEANVTAAAATRSMLLKTLDIGGNP